MKKIFLSWSGDVSKTFALAVEIFLKEILPDIDAFVSSGPQNGSEWFRSILDNLRNCDCIIPCLTTSNLRSHWLHFETGFVAARQGAERVERNKVFPMVLNVPIDEIGAPFSFYHAYSIEADRLEEFAESISKNLGKSLLHNSLRSICYTFNRLFEVVEGIDEQFLHLPRQKSNRQLLEELHAKLVLGSHVTYEWRSIARVNQTFGAIVAGGSTDHPSVSIENENRVRETIDVGTDHGKRRILQIHLERFRKELNSCL